MTVTAQMNPTIKQRWVEELRSGKYQQGKGHLRDSGEMYCCLGVLCDIIEPGAWKLDPGQTDVYMHGKGHETLPSDTVLTMAGLPGRDSAYYDEVIDVLVTMNDTYNNTFSEIADWIEENL